MIVEQMKEYRVVTTMIEVLDRGIGDREKALAARQRLREQLLVHILPLQELFELILFGIGICGFLEWFPLRFFQDGEVRFQALLQLVQQHTLSNMSYSMVGPSFSLPLWLMDTILPIYQKAHWWQGRYNIFLLASAFIVAYLILRKHMDPGLLRKSFLIILVATTFGNAITFFGGEVFTSLSVGMGILVALLAWEFVGWAAVVLGVVNTPASLLGLGLVALSKVLQSKRLRYCLIVITAIALIYGESWLRRGSPFDNGYGDQAFSTPFFFGLVSILFSAGKGLIFFFPALLLPVKKAILTGKGAKTHQIYEAYKLWIWFIVGMILLYARWWSWEGGWFWGPRFFIFASIPAAFALAARLRNPSKSLFANVLTLLVLSYSLWVGIEGTIFDQFNLNNSCMSASGPVSSMCYFDPSYSALWHPFEVPITLSHDDKLFLLFSVLVFLYLAAPLLVLIVRQTITRMQELRAGQFNWRTWKF